MAASTWWPTPAAPSKWFTAQQITNSKAFHRPPATMSKVAAAISLGLIVVLGLVLRSGSPSTSADAVRVGYLGLLLTPLAVLVPLIGFNWWNQDRHRPSFGIDRPPLGQILMGSVVATAVLSALSTPFGSGSGFSGLEPRGY